MQFRFVIVRLNEKYSSRIKSNKRKKKRKKKKKKRKKKRIIRIARNIASKSNDVIDTNDKTLRLVSSTAGTRN